MRAPRRCLRSSCPSTCPDESGLDLGRDLVFEPLQYTEALGLTSSRSSDYSLVKELSRSHTSADDFHRLCRAFPDPVPVRGGGIIASAARLSTGVVRNAHVTLARRRRNRQPIRKASISKVLLQQRAADDATPEFRHPGRSRPKNGFVKPSGLCRRVRFTSRPYEQLFFGVILPLTVRREGMWVHGGKKIVTFFNC